MVSAANPFTVVGAARDGGIPDDEIPF
jgi:hypothetical protein